MTNLDDVTISKAQYAVSRRGFLIGASTFGAGLSIGFLPGLASGASEKAAMDEVNAWVQIATDDTVTVRIVRSEMGQGTLTGLAQLVAEELQCDWDKVTWEFPTPGESLARERVWGSFSTGGSRGLRSSQQYVREGGAAARMMLVQAAAN
jgi:isoquinoline 1-oxidoreductase beta subunit